MRDYSTYRNTEIADKARTAGFGILDVMVTGVTGAGKSTTLNTLFRKNVAEVGDGADPMTMELDSYKLSDTFRLWDTPGLGDGVAQDARHKRKLIDLLWKPYGNNNEFGFIDMVLVIVDGSGRDMGTVYRLINEIVLRNIPEDRVLVAINQADMAMHGRHWNSATNTPDAELERFLHEKALSVQARIREATGACVPLPVCYSAEKDYNVPQLLDLVVNSMPRERRRLCA